MLKQNTNSNRQGMTYNINSVEERKQIMELKRQGKKSREIAIIMNKKQKSIESVNNEERKSEYKEFKQTMISYGLKIFMNDVKYHMMDKKKLSKQIRIFINQALSSQKNNEFRLLIPKGRKYSSQRRVREKIVETIVTSLLSKQNILENDKQANQNQNQKDIHNTQENLEINQKNQISNDYEESQEDQESNDQNDYLIIDPITPFHLNLRQETINYFQSYQRINEAYISEDLSTNYANTFQLFQQSVEKSSQNDSNETQLSSN